MLTAITPSQASECARSPELPAPSALYAQPIAFVRLGSAGSIWPCDCFPRFPRRRLSNRDLPADAEPGTENRVQSGERRQIHARWHERSCDREQVQGQVPGGPACQECPVAIRFEEAIRGAACSPVYFSRCSPGARVNGVTHPV